MLASLNWIKEFVEVESSSEEIADRLSMAGLEIEAAKRLGSGLDQVVTAQLTKCERHPNADRLTLCEVTAGKEKLSVVCGAKNMKVGDKVVLAKPGTKLPNGLTIKKSKIRDVLSNGMLCSETELGLSEDSAGIMILDPDTKSGIPLTEALPIQDQILEVNVTPNRGDCLSMMGLAREVAANFHRPFRPKVTKIQKGPSEKGSHLKVDNRAPDLCPRYSCRVIRGIKVGPSPIWIRQRLEACGIRSINNVVDSTNYVMLETGQPLHAFDLKQIKEKKVLIRRAQEGEIMNTLDGEPRKLLGEDLVIADGKRVLALGGVMGGEDSGVEESTQDLLLESANFSPQSVRKTAKRFALQTESSYRFERGVDPNACVRVLDRLAELIVQLAGGEISGQAIDVYPRPVPPQEITLRTSQIKRVLGVDLEPKDWVEPLRSLGITGAEGESGSYQLNIPTFRSDLSREIDLIEEIARLYGYNKIPITYPKIALVELLPPMQNTLDRLDRVRQILADWGFSGIVHYSFTSQELLGKYQLDFSPKQTLLNPLSEDLSVMRPALFPQMIETLRKNVFHGSKNLKLYEIRPVYREDPSVPSGVKESWHLCLGRSGNRRPYHFLESEEEVTVLDLKGYLSSLVERELGSPLDELPLDRPYFHPKRQALLRVEFPGHEREGQDLGILGRLHPHFMEEMDLPVPIVVAEINLDLFLTEWKNSIQFEEISPFPTVWRDLNLVLNEGTLNGDALDVIRAQGGPWIRRVELLDVYRGKPLQEGQKALTYRIEYRAPDRTLTDEEVNKAREKLLEKLFQQIGATLR